MSEETPQVEQPVAEAQASQHTEQQEAPQGDGNPDYINEHPNAITDPKLAESMAYASTDAEQEAVALANQAVKQAENLNRNPNHADLTQTSLNRAENARVVADNNASLAKNVYEQAQHIKRGKHLE